MEDCIFCKIAAGEIPADKVYEDDDIIAFRDISPMAPTHILLIPRRHIASLSETGEADGGLLAHLLATAKETAAKEGIDVRGYRLVINCGPEGGQIVGHLHLHLLGGRKLDDQLG